MDPKVIKTIVNILEVSCIAVDEGHCVSQWWVKKAAANTHCMICHSQVNC